MKVYEMKPNEIGEAVETADAIIVTLHEPNEKDRVLIISRKDMSVSSTLVSMKITDSSIKKNLGAERGEMVKKDGAHVIYKNVLDAFRHAKTNDDMMAVIERFYPLYKPLSRETMVYAYRRAIAEGVVSIPCSDIVTKKRKTRRKVLKSKEMTYLPIKNNDLLGKSLNGTIPLNVYKRYGVRLYNNPSADIMSRVNSAKEPVVSLDWMRDTMKSVFDTYNIFLSDSRYNAYVMFLKESGLIKMQRTQNKKGEYVITRAPEIPKTIST